MRTGVYVRISKDITGEALGVQRQETESRHLAEKLGWDVVEVYVDNDISASSGKTRPAYRRMLEDMQKGRLSAIVAWHPDRLYRLPHELEELITIADSHGVMFSTCRAGEIDLSTASGRLVARLLGAVARHEAEMKGERQSAKRRQLAVAGRLGGGGYRSFGWKDDRLTLDEHEAAIVRVLAEKVLAGETLNGLVTWLTVEGVLTSTGSTRWSTSPLRRMLCSPRLAGLSVHRGEIVGKGRWEPILDETTWRKVKERLEYNGTRRNTIRVALFGSKMIRCGICGYGLLTYRRGEDLGGLRAYGCRERSIAGKPGFQKACNRIAIKAEALEDDVSERLIARLVSGDSRRLIEAASESSTEVVDSTIHQLSELEERLRQLGVDYADGVLGRTEFVSARNRLSERLDATRNRLVVDEGPTIPMGSLEQMATWWDDAELSTRRAVVESNIDKITVGPHTGARAKYDPTRVTIAWR